MSPCVCFGMHLLTDSDRARITEAVTRAEERTSGEIVPVIVKRSAPYRVVSYRAGVSGAVLGALLHELIVLGWDGWGLPLLLSDGALFLWMLGFGVLLGWAAQRIGFLFRHVAGGGLIDFAVHQRAETAFLEEEVFATRERTGILLLVSLDEHRVEVLGDSGINRLVAPEDWGDVVEAVIRGMRAGRLADGLVSAIDACGALLERKGVARRDDDSDELSNAPRVQ